MPRKLSYNALLLMEGQKVLVKDLEYDAFDQICEVKMKRICVKNPFKNDSYKPVVTKLWLENEEFIFEYEGTKCYNGEFEVYSI